MDRKGGLCVTEKELLAARQSIVQKLTQARLEKGLSQEQLAKRIGTQRSNICRIEKGTQNLSLDLMLKIAEALDKDECFIPIRNTPDILDAVFGVIGVAIAYVFLILLRKNGLVAK